jgi:hypothetical protein
MGESLSNTPFQEHEDYLVPSDYKEDPSLGMWVMKQHIRHEGLDSE